MQIRRFYTPELSPEDKTISLPPAEANHALRILRLQEGDRLQLFNGRGLVADAELMPLGTERRPKEASCRILAADTRAQVSPALTLFVAPPRGKAFDLVLKAAVELGVAVIQPILCAYGVARPDGTSANWQETLVAALKQSANPYLPVLLPPKEFDAALTSRPLEGAFFGASPAAEATPHQPLTLEGASGARSLWVGPEGGFSPDEEAALLQAKAIPITLGHCILRVETAIPALLGCLYGIATMNLPRHD